ncbi:ribosomal protein L11 methylase PrmA [Methylohalomonas lacus]|uniref:Ribosomal protein L11 methylase PrmA n=1 Tax=Methylohalomonas lacus TaxID=398773 RepID=A0AAE3L1H1_9GAMM|nr:SAM-dependent methyltransferase [Methylohalomonas lacus]MCS3903565.1 ribosomal protein L11 methylase PrmA [Methylohalomonas lacus]
MNNSYRDNYDYLMGSGLYQDLVSRGWLVSHEEVAGVTADSSKAYRILRPEQIEFISYPYEWSFSQLKDAALLTLDMQLRALSYDMTLTDASAYNVQFHEGRPVMIDTLSFHKYTEGSAWAGYRQFCQHFLAPLALMAGVDVRLNQLLRVHIDGIPLDLVSRLLPRRTWFKPGLAIHVHIHAKTQNAQAATDHTKRGSSRFQHVSQDGLISILQGLRKTVAKLDWQPAGTEWADYYQATNYTDEAFEFKRMLVGEYLQQVRPQDVWDLGANTGEFSQVAASLGIPTLAFDIDPAAVETNYRRVRERGESNLLPLLLDLSNPSPGLGWNERERASFTQRGPADCVLALALIHHLSISNNVPFDRVAEFFADVCGHLVIEFVPKRDSQVQRLLRTREDIFGEYDQEHFEEAFRQYFDIRRAEPIRGSERVLYLMEKRQS